MLSGRTIVCRERRVVFFFAALCALFLQPSRLTLSAPLEFVPQRVIQPDGTILECYASGDEYYNWLHDGNGYTIVQDPISGYYVYAANGKGGIVPSSHIAGRVDPATLGFQRWLTDPPDVAQRARDHILSALPAPIGLAPTTGVLNNIVLFIRFSDEPEFTDQSSTYATMFNSTTPGTNSLYNYYQEVSYGKLSVTTTFYPLAAVATVVSYQDAHPRAYYQPYNAVTDTIGYNGGDNGTERRDREQLLLKNAIQSVGSQIPTGLVVDSDGDGRVDNVCFIIKGSTTGWSSLLWPHMWALYSQTVSINGKRVWDYNVQLQNSLLPGNAGVLAHEMGHTIGAPDLYHYTSNPVTPVGSWDLMASNSNPPQHMGAYMKHKYAKWIASIPTISTPGRYFLHPVTSPSGNCYKIPSPYSSSEYFVVEYRKKTTLFESKLPGEGMLVYRVNTARSGNANGPPDEIYIYRPGGSSTVNGSLGTAGFSQESGRDVINDNSDPPSFLSSGFPGGLNITAIGTRGDSIGFTLGIPIPAVISAFTAVAVHADSVLVSWTTLAECRNKGFEVQSALRDTGLYVTVNNGYIPGSGTSVSPHTYTFVDRTNTGQRFYRLSETDSTGKIFFSDHVLLQMPTAVNEPVPTAYALSQNYPNPFNPSTSIRYEIAEGGHVLLAVYDVLGREVATLVNERKPAGTYAVQFSGSGLASGIYFCRLTAGTLIETRKLVLER
jgi:M6 family metalloprotease-like protein